MRMELRMWLRACMLDCPHQQGPASPAAYGAWQGLAATQSAGQKTSAGSAPCMQTARRVSLYKHVADILALQEAQGCQGSVLSSYVLAWIRLRSAPALSVLSCVPLFCLRAWALAPGQAARL